MSRLKMTLGAGLLGLLCLAVLLAARLRSTKPLPAAQRAASVVSIHRSPIAASLSVAGQFQPYQEVDLHAKVSGYIRRINVDIGDHVRQGQVLATLDVPELGDQFEGAEAEVRHTQSNIARAQSEVAAAKATYAAVHSQYTRLAEAAHQRPGLIAQQELDDAEAKDAQAQAYVGVGQASLNAVEQQLGVSKAETHRLMTLSAYEQIVAPLNGVITMRFADTGSLIQAGQNSNTQTMPVVRVAQTDLLRLRMPIPESDVPYIAAGSPVQIRVDATGRSLAGKIIRFTRALDSSTRTMLAEVDVPNQDLSLSPGMYAEATIELQQKNAALIVPVQALVQDGATNYVLLLDSDNRVRRCDVSLGIQTAQEMEITRGLREGDRVIVSGQSNYQQGDKVTPHAAFLPNAALETN